MYIKNYLDKLVMYEEKRGEIINQCVRLNIFVAFVFQKMKEVSLRDTKN